VGHPEPLVQDSRFERAVSFPFLEKAEPGIDRFAELVDSRAAGIEQVHPSSARSLAQLTLPPSEIPDPGSVVPSSANASALPCVSGAGPGLPGWARHCWPMDWP